MVKIRPFKAYRPTLEKVDCIAALPYDVMNTQEARAIIEKNNCSFLKVDKPEAHVGYGVALDEAAGCALNDLISQGLLIEEPSEALYIYGLETSYAKQYGLVGVFDTKQYETGIIKKHENTRTDKEEERIKHVSACKAHTGPIFMAYKDEGSLLKWVHQYRAGHEAIYDFVTEDGTRQVIYKIGDTQDIEEVMRQMGTLEALYVADGHHRLAAAAHYARKHRQDSTQEEEYEYFLGVAFATSELCIMDYNRVLKDESGLTKEAYLEVLGRYFEVVPQETAVKPSKRHEWGMNYKGQWYKLNLKEGIINEQDTLASLDVSILQNLVLEPIFHIHNPKEDPRIDFVGGIRGIEELDKRIAEGMDLAFSLYPTSMVELMKIADAGLLMPPKSTWFEPKLRSGLFIHRF